MSSYRERLRVPWLWWPLLAGLAASVWLAYHHAYGTRVSLPAGAGTLVLGGAALIAYGRVHIAVDATHFRAGGARLPLTAVGEVVALTGPDARAARGPELHPAAYLVLRGYVDATVRVAVADDTDPVPYWLVSTRRPERLAEALAAGRDHTAAGH